jgi:hypothetical protein
MGPDFGSIAAFLRAKRAVFRERRRQGQSDIRFQDMSGTLPIGVTKGSFYSNLTRIVKRGCIGFSRRGSAITSLS